MVSVVLSTQELEACSGYSCKYIVKFFVLKCIKDVLKRVKIEETDLSKSDLLETEQAIHVEEGSATLMASGSIWFDGAAPCNPRKGEGQWRRGLQGLQKRACLEGCRKPLWVALRTPIPCVKWQPRSNDFPFSVVWG